MAEQRKPRRRRKKKSGKYTPLVWLITGVLIALSLVYSNTLFKSRYGSDNSDLETNGNPLGNLESVASNIFNSYTQRRTNKNQSDETTEPTDTESATPSLTEIFENYIPDETDDSVTSVEPSLTKVGLFLAKYSDNKVKITDVDIYLEYEDSLLKETLQTLIDYRDDDSLLNLIPFNTAVNNIKIKDRVAYIDFSEEFAYNSYGVIGYQIQVYQIVYTATQFDTIDAVYFYLEGEPLNYLGGDGYPLNNPIYPYSYLPQFEL